MTTTPAERVTLQLRLTSVPAKQLPAGLWIDVLDVLRAHGLDASPTEVTSALARLVRHTPVADGGRLLPDGSIDQADIPDAKPAWYCTRCGRDMWMQDEKDQHDRWCPLPT